MARLPLAPHVQAAISATAQARPAPGLNRPLAPHVQSAVAAAQPRMAPANAPRLPAPPPAPHVQAQIARAAQPQAAPPPRPAAAPHVQAAMARTVQPQASPAAPRPAAPHVQAAAARGAVVQPVMFTAAYNGKSKVSIDSKDVEASPQDYVKARTVVATLKEIAEGEEFSTFTMGKKYRKHEVRTPTSDEQEEAKAALDALRTQKDFLKKEKNARKREKQEERAEEISKAVVKNAAEITDQELKFGKLLARVGERSHKWAVKKYRLTDVYKTNVKTIEAQTDTTTILEDQSAWRQMEALVDSKIKTSVINLGGQSVWVNLTTDEDKPSPPNIQINLGRQSAYQNIGTDTKIHDSLGHRQLNVLEVIRDPKSTSSELIKQDLYSKKHLATSERFSDTSKTAFQEFKKINREKDPKEVRRVQIASSKFILDIAVDKMGDDQFGRPVRDEKRKVNRPQTTPKNLKRKLEDYLTPDEQTKKDKRLRKKRKLDLVKDGQRLVRSMIGEDFSSDEDVSDEELI